MLKIVIIGVGLIGGSIGLACRKAGIAGEVVGTGRSAERLEAAVRLGAVDRYELPVEKAVAGANLVIISQPVGMIYDTALLIKPHLKNAVVIDVGSVKGNLVKRLDALYDSDVSFIGCHPVAGKEKTGVEAAEAGLFEGRLTIITPAMNTSYDAVDRVRGFWESLGSRVMLMGAERHDMIYGLVSHLPQMIAYCLVNQMADKEASGEEGLLGFAGGGLADYMRLGGSSPEMWRDIALLNRDNILVSLKEYKKVLNRLTELLENKDAGEIGKFFERSNALWEKTKQ